MGRSLFIVHLFAFRCGNGTYAVLRTRGVDYGSDAGAARMFKKSTREIPSWGRPNEALDLTGLFGGRERGFWALRIGGSV